MSIVQHNDDWQVISRYCEAGSADESVVMWHDVNPADGLIQPTEIVLLEWMAVADALLLSSYDLERAPQTRLAASEVGASSFATQMRTNLDVRSHVVQSDLRQPLSVSVLRGILGARVRELESNSIALTHEAR